MSLHHGSGCRREEEGLQATQREWDLRGKAVGEWQAVKSIKDKMRMEHNEERM